jgi:hypothetical protein
MFQAVLIVVWAVSISPAANEKTPPDSGPRCQTSGKDEITITCNYRATPRSASNRNRDSRVALRRTVFSFEPHDASNLRAELTFTNIGARHISDARAVYLAIDDDAGNNYVRRMLPTVDFRRLLPGKSLTFSEELRVAAFPPGHYMIQLWIPDPEASRKFNPAHNFLLGNSGVANVATRLNILADFTVERLRE